MDQKCRWGQACAEPDKRRQVKKWRKKSYRYQKSYRIIVLKIVLYIFLDLEVLRRTLKIPKTKSKTTLVLNQYITLSSSTTAHDVTLVQEPILCPYRSKD